VCSSDLELSSFRCIGQKFQLAVGVPRVIARSDFEVGNAQLLCALDDLIEAVSAEQRCEESNFHGILPLVFANNGPGSISPERG
jgi:hypothetical protein